MALPVFIRPARKEEGPQFFEWSKNVPGFDPEIAYHPNTVTLAAFNKSKVIAYMPVQAPFFLETLALNPEATNIEAATAMAEFVKYLVSQCIFRGVPEIYFLGTDQLTDTFAVKHVFEEMPYKLYRVKVSDLEPNKE